MNARIADNEQLAQYLQFAILAIQGLVKVELD